MSAMVLTLVGYVCLVPNYCCGASAPNEQRVCYFVTLFDLPQNTNNDKTRQLQKSK